MVSAISGGNPDEVFVDFVVPSTPFSVRAVISGTTPADTNIQNNSAVTETVTPILDDDHDSVPNATDNCPAVSNADQKDTDGDGIGDACDDDIDGDGLSNAVEAELGTNPLVKDTDGDGVDDAHDAFPLDPTRSVVQKVNPLVSNPNQVKVSDSKTNQAVTNSTPSVSDTVQETPIMTQTPSVPGIAASNTKNVSFSPNAVFKYVRSSWNTILFSVIAPNQDSAVYEWDFGDGVHSSKVSVLHIFDRPGTYTVTLKTTDSKGSVLTESTIVAVPFFTLSNPFVLFSLIALVALLMLGFITLIFLRPTRRRQVTNVEEFEVDELQEELPSDSPRRIYVKEE